MALDPEDRMAFVEELHEAKESTFFVTSSITCPKEESDRGSENASIQLNNLLRSIFVSRLYHRHYHPELFASRSTATVAWRCARTEVVRNTSSAAGTGDVSSFSLSQSLTLPFHVSSFLSPLTVSRQSCSTSMDLHSSNNRSHRSFFPLYQSSPHDHIHSQSQQSATTSTLSQDPPPPSVTIGPIPGHPFPKDFPKEKRSALPEVGQTRCCTPLAHSSSRSKKLTV